MPIIILEGVDGSGKSTLAAKLAVAGKAAGYNVIQEHRGPIKQTVIDEYVRPLFEVGPDDLLIADRWHLGELIYGPLYRDISLAKPHLEAIEGLLDMLHAVRVIVTAPLPVIRQRLEARGEDYLKPEHVERVHGSYIDFGTRLGYYFISTHQGIDDALIEAFILNATSHREDTIAIR